MPLTQLSDDILLYILSTFLDLNDTLSILSTCKSLHSLSHQKQLWITSLTHESKHRALSCPISFDMYTSSASELRKVAIATFRLKANWSSTMPRTTGALLRYKYAEEHELFTSGGEILTVIPNTRFMVLFCIGKILCRDLSRAAQPYSTDCIDVGGYYSWYTYDYRPGELFIGLITTQEEDIRLSLVRIEFTEHTCSAPELLWKTALTEECKSLFIVDNIIGFISFSRLSEMHLKLMDIRDSSRSKEIVLELPGCDFSSVDYKSCWVQNGELYLHLQISITDHEIYRIKFDHHLPESNGSETKKEKAKMILVMNDKWSNHHMQYPTFWTPWLKMAARGLQTAQVFSGAAETEENPRLTMLSFWPLSYDEKVVYSENNLKRSHLEIPGEITFYEHEESGYLTFRSYSGTYAVMIIATPQRWSTHSADPHLQLYLFHFDSESGTIPFRKLDVPECVCLDDVFSISIEERSGMIYLVDVHGWLFGLPFGYEGVGGESGERSVLEGMECLSVGEAGHVRRVEVTNGN